MRPLEAERLEGGGMVNGVMKFLPLEHRRLLINAPNFAVVIVVLIVGLVAGRFIGKMEWAPEGLTHQPMLRVCNGSETVPRIVHATGREDHPTDATLRSVSDGFQLHYRNDTSARAFVRDRCGAVYATAFDCLVPGAFRADLFRMCALYAEGGVYMDGDIVAVRPLDEIFSMCQPATIAFDRKTYGIVPKKQMAFMAAAPGHALYRCHMDRIVEHVRQRYHPWIETQVTGPNVFHECYTSVNSPDVAVGLIDLGMPRNVFASVPTTLEYPDVVAYQMRKRPGKNHYAAKFKHGGKTGTYTADCPL